MAKVKTRKRGSTRGSIGHMRSVRTTWPIAAPLVETTTANGGVPAASGTTRILKRPNSRFGTPGSSGLVTSGMVMLGCWGMTIFFFFLYPDPNHVLFGCFAALMALMWSYSFVVRLRKLRRRA